MSYRDIIAQVRELESRKLSSLEIAQRLAMSLNDVLFVQKMLTTKPN